MAVAEYIGLETINGPFVLVEGVQGAGYGELVDVVGPDGKARKGRVVVLYHLKQAFLTVRYFRTVHLRLL